ncbi:hypothetical protein ACFE04_012623 [Oxalis oulophora]
MDRLHQEIATLRQSLYDDGLVNQQFGVLDSNGIVDEIFESFFSEIPKNITEMELAMQESPKNVGRLRNALHKLTYISRNFGVKKMNNAVILTKVHIDEEIIKDIEGVKYGMQKIYQEFVTIRNRLYAYFEVQTSEFCFNILSFGKSYINPFRYHFSATEAITIRTNLKIVKEFTGSRDLA